MYVCIYIYIYLHIVICMYHFRIVLLQPQQLFRCWGLVLSWMRWSPPQAPQVGFGCVNNHWGILGICHDGLHYIFMYTYVHIIYIYIYICIYIYIYINYIYIYIYVRCAFPGHQEFSSKSMFFPKPNIVFATNTTTVHSQQLSRCPT